MNELIKIGTYDISTKEYGGQRVITFKDIDTVHERPDGTARKRFNDNKGRFIEGEDFFVRKTDEAKTEFGIVAPNGLILLTKQGYLMLVKSFTDNLAWDVQRKLVNGYFRSKQLDIIPTGKELMALALLEAHRTLAERSETVDITRSDGTPDVRMNTKRKQKGRLFLYEKLKVDGVIPVIEMNCRRVS